MERVEAGRAAARARGVTGGRKPYLDQRRVALAQKLYADKFNSIDFICSTLKIGRATLYRYVKTGVCETNGHLTRARRTSDPVKH